MKQKHNSSQPEAAWYQARLHKKRRFRLVAGVVLLCFALYFFFSELISFPIRDSLSLVVYLSFSLLLIWYGASEILANRGPVPLEDINRLRQNERSTLFRRAQGTLPWQYRSWVRLIELFLAVCCLYLAAGHTVLVTAYRAQWFMGGVYLFVGLLLLADAFYFKPGQAARLAEKSATELSFRLKAGEATGDSQSEPNT
jgi:hypothetical protein